jgi:hypothetical protein
MNEEQFKSFLKSLDKEDIWWQLKKWKDWMERDSQIRNERKGLLELEVIL